MNFKDILETLPSIEHLTGLDVLNGETVIHHIPAAPGKLGSLRLYNALAENLTENNTALTLNIAANYGGCWDIVQATQQLAEK